MNCRSCPAQKTTKKRSNWKNPRVPRAVSCDIQSAARRYWPKQDASAGRAPAMVSGSVTRAASESRSRQANSVQGGLAVSTPTMLRTVGPSLGKREPGCMRKKPEASTLKSARLLPMATDCSECPRLWREYSQATGEHIKIEGQLRLAILIKDRETEQRLTPLSLMSTG